ncbi:MAG: translocation/assembly module TamB domain-containing protein [Candidatus Dependentiae bacterium]
MLKQLVLSCIAGLCIVGFMAQRDTWIQQYVLDYFITQFQYALDCRVSCRLQDCSMSGLQLQCRNLQVMPKNGTDWSWRAKQFNIGFSWWQLLLYGSFDFSIYIQNMHAYSQIKDDELAIANHLYLAFRGPQLSIYTFLKDMECDDLFVTIEDRQKHRYVDLHWDIQAKKIDNCFNVAVDLYKGSLLAQERTLFKNMSGSLQFDSFDGHPTIDVCVKGAASIEMPQLGSEVTPCYISGAWHHNQGTFSLKNVDHSFAIDPVLIKKDGNGLQVSVEAKLPLNYVWHMLTNDNDDNRLSGSCALQAKYGAYDDTDNFHGHVSAQRMRWQDKEIGSLAKITFNKNTEDLGKAHFGGGLYLQRTSGACVAGSWSCCPQEGIAQASIKNNARLTFSPKHDWQILPDDLTISCDVDGHGALHVHYDGKATHAKVQNHIVSSGTALIQGAHVEAEGTLDENRYKLNACYDPVLYLNSFDYANAQGDTLVQMTGNEEQHYSGFIDVGCVKDILKKRLQYDLQGEGIFKLNIDKIDQCYHANVHLVNGAIRLPRTYNFVQGFDCDLFVDPLYKKCTVQDLVCTLHNGIISTQKMHVVLADDLSPSFVYAPVLIDRCLLNVEKELFAIVSGSMLLSKKQDADACLKGHLIIDRSQLKENLFSDVFQKNMRNYTAYSFDTHDDDLQCDITIKTKYPVRVQTPFLQTDARINLSIKNKVRDPHVSGSVNLSTGQLHFPYKPLYITKGSLHFSPGKLDDPLIELEAKNCIKKNNINLHVTGSLQNQHVSLEASPTLSEEQIISLLLVGSQEESLNMVMPALIMQNIKSILFGYDQTTHNASRYFGNLLKPFRRIHLVPSFIDQSGRGGLRGAIEIDISDRWRAVIQKNFSLTEDTRFELEYLLSDDISVRATRDIRRDLIGEVEMRYKFGD